MNHDVAMDEDVGEGYVRILPGTLLEDGDEWRDSYNKWVPTVNIGRLLDRRAILYRRPKQQENPVKTDDIIEAVLEAAIFQRKRMGGYTCGKLAAAVDRMVGMGMPTQRQARPAWIPPGEHFVMVIEDDRACKSRWCRCPPPPRRNASRQSHDHPPKQHRRLRHHQPIQAGGGSDRRTGCVNRGKS